MKNWSIKLVVATIVTVAACLLLTALCRMLHIQFWTQFVAIGASFLIAGVIMMYGIKIVQNMKLAALLAIIPTAISFCANQWCFYSANATEHFAGINELLEAKEKPLYFTLDEYYWNADGVGLMESTTEYKRRGRTTSTTKTTYLAMPLYPDSISEEIRVWMVDNYPSKDYKATDTYEELMQLGKVLNFELLTEDLEDYKEAVSYSELKDKAENAILIKPLYKEYITKNTWALYFLMSLVAGSLIMALIGLIVSKRRRDEEEAATEEETN